MIPPPPRSTLFPYTTLFRSPIEEYSPSVFSRTTQKSMSPGLRLASGDGTPGISRTGRRLTYWSNSRRNRRSEEHTSELQSHVNLVCRLLLEKKKQKKYRTIL